MKRAFSILLACTLGILLLASCGKKTDTPAPASDETSILQFLETVYPNTLDESQAHPRVTDRFREYASAECDYDAIYATQDCYCADILPEPSFEACCSAVDHAYKVVWHRYAEAERVVVIVVLVEEDGDWMIDNIVEDEETGRLLFDYSKPPVSIFD